MNHRGEVLIAVINNEHDLAIARDQHWYRIPVAQAEKLQQQVVWPPQWLAFYQTKIFGADAYTVRHYARVSAIRDVYRWELFPGQPNDAKREQRYCKLELSPLETLPHPIVSQNLRRIAFIATTWEKFTKATVINELLKN